MTGYKAVMVIFLLSAKSETLCSWEHRTQGKVKEDEHEGACLCINVRVCSGERAGANPVYVLLSVCYAFYIKQLLNKAPYSHKNRVW